MMFSLVCEECYKRFSPVVLKKGTVPQNSNDNRYLNADFEPKVEKESNQNKKRLTQQKGFKIKIFFLLGFNLIDMKENSTSTQKMTSTIVALKKKKLTVNEY